MATASRNRISSLQARFVASDQDVSSLPGPGLCRSVLELVTFDNTQLKYSTVQNWYPGVDQGKGGIYNFVTKRGKCLGVSFLRWHWRTTINKRMPYWNARV